MREETSLKIVVDVLKNRKSLPVGNLNLGYTSDVITMTGWSQCSYLTGVTKENALRDILNAKNKFMDLLEKANDLADFIKDKKVEFYLGIDESGKGGINLCKEVDGQIKW